MKKSAVYTRGGDKGETSLVSGKRIPKSTDRIALYGDVDELNSHIGYCISLISQDSQDFEELIDTLTITQSRLFDLGSRLACEDELWDKYKLPNINDEFIKMLEEKIDILDSELPKLKAFILPGGAVAASYFHIVRTVCRRVERELVAFSNDGNKVPDNSLIFLNRLSDYLFVAARYVNFKQKQHEVLWNA